MDLTTNKPRPSHQSTSQKQDIALIHHQAILEDWLSGYRPAEIAARQSISIELVHGGIRSIRKQLYEDNQATLSEHAEQSVSVLRRLQTRLWEEYEKVIDKGKAGLLLLDTIRKTEESIAKIRGVLQNRVIADVIHHVKMYDFQDKFPNENGRSSEPAETKILESGSYALSPISKKDIPEPEPYTTTKPEFDEGPVVVMPNGDIIDIEKAIKGEW